MASKRAGKRKPLWALYEPNGRLYEDGLGLDVRRDDNKPYPPTASPCHYRRVRLTPIKPTKPRSKTRHDPRR